MRTTSNTLSIALASAAALLLAAMAFGLPTARAQTPAGDGPRLKLPVPKSVQAVQNLLGIGRPRLALVIGNSMIDRKPALPAAARDAQSVAGALRAGGFVVMVREDLTANEIRANLDEFRQRLEPESAALIYFVGVGGQVDGRNVVLGRNAQIDPNAPPAALAEAWKRAAVPLAEIVNALEGPPGSPRLLVVDASYDLPALAKPIKAGLAEQPLPPGLMVLSVAAPNAVVEPAVPDALPSPAPTDPRRTAATLFGRELVRSLTTAGISAPDALRLTRRSVLDATSGKQSPWLAGETDSSEDFADAKLLDALPKSPQEVAQEAAKQAAQEQLQARNRAQTGQERRPEADARSNPLTETALKAAQAVGATAAGAAVAAKAAEAQALTTAAGTAANVATQAGATAADVVGRARPLSSTPPAQASPPASPAAPAAAPPTQVAAARPPAPAVPKLPPPLPPPPSVSSNPFGYSIGDTFTYRVIDGWKNTTSSTYAHAIEEVMPDGTLRANNNFVHLDPQGRVITQISQRGRHEYQPYQDLFWNNPKRGESRDVKFREFYERPDTRGEIEWKGDLSVGRPRTIELPAGKFEVVPIHGDGWYTETNGLGKGSGRWNRTVWYSPQLGHPVAIDIEETDWNGRLARRERVELMHAQKGSKSGMTTQPLQK